MILSTQQLANMLEGGRIEPYATKKEIIEACKLAKKYSLGVFFVTPGYLPLVVKELQNSKTKVGVAIGFPFGSTSPSLHPLWVHQMALRIQAPQRVQT